MSEFATLPGCPDCGCKMSVDETVHARGNTYRKLRCACGGRFETEESITRRLPPVATRTRPSVPVGTGGHPPIPVDTGPPSSGGGVGGGLPSGRIPQQISDSDPNPITSVLSDPRARARRKPRATREMYPLPFEDEWALTAKTGSKDKACDRWEKLGRPQFGKSWRLWEACPEWRQDWFNYPHVATWLNDGRYKQDPAEAKAKPIAERKLLPFAVAAEDAREEASMQRHWEALSGKSR